MPLTTSQNTALKNDILANTNTIPSGQPWTNSFAGVQIKNIPNNDDGNFTIAGWYSQIANPTYWVWDTTISRADIYTSVSDLGSPTVWNWTTYQAQSVTQQNSWVQIFMGDQCNMALINNRAGVHAIFGATGTQRSHVFAVSRRKASIIEKLFAIAPQAVGGLTVDATTGNISTDPLGGTTNPAVMVFEGFLSNGDVSTARNS